MGPPNALWEPRPMSAGARRTRLRRAGNNGVQGLMPTTTQHSLPGGALQPYLGRSFTDRTTSASPDAPEPEVRIYFPPVENPHPPLAGIATAVGRSAGRPHF